MQEHDFEKLNREIIICQRCPRLIKYCVEVSQIKRKSYAAETYWGRPVPNFGAFPAKLLVVGLAPAAHGGNRTGRMFTGDESGRWLYRTLNKFGFSESTGFQRTGDNRLVSTVITAVNHCAPPGNKPTQIEMTACQNYLVRTYQLANPQCIICLGEIAWKAISKVISSSHKDPIKEKFRHGAEIQLGDQLILASYHPSQQNTFTKKLTEPMFDSVFQRAKIWIQK